jgi:hypothetical protein
MIGPEAKAVVPALIEALKDREKDVRRAAAMALEGVGPTQMSIPPLQIALEDQEAEVRQNAATALGSFGPMARSPAPQLGKTVKDPDPKVRAAAALAFWRVQGDTKAILPEFKKLLKEKDPLARVTAAEGLWEASHDLEALHILVAALREEGRRHETPADALLPHFYWGEETSARFYAANALMRYGANAKEVIPELRKILKQQHNPKKCLAGSVLAKLDLHYGNEARLSTEELTRAFEKARMRSRCPALTGYFSFGCICFSSSDLDRENLVDESDDINVWSGTILLPKRLRPKDPEPDQRGQDDPIGS